MTSSPPVRIVRSLRAAVRIRELRAAGHTDRLLRVRGRLTRDQLRRAERGEPIGWDVRRRVLALPEPLCTDLFDAPFPTRGARRRLGALMAIGWPRPYLRRLVGDTEWRLIFGRSDRCRRHPTRVHLRVCTVYDLHWDLVPEEHGVPADLAELTRAEAVDDHFFPPLCWTDELLDAEKCPPVRGSRHTGLGTADQSAVLRALEGEPVPLNQYGRTAAVEYGIRRRGMDPRTVSDSLGMPYATVKRSFERAKETARKQGDTWPDEPRFRPETAIEPRSRRPVAAA